MYQQLAARTEYLSPPRPVLDQPPGIEYRLRVFVGSLVHDQTCRLLDNGELIFTSPLPADPEHATAVQVVVGQSVRPRS